MSNNFDFNDLLDGAKGLMEKTHQDLTNVTARSEAGAGLVSVTLNADYQITELNIDKTLLKESLETLEELVKSAVNDAGRKLCEAKREKMNPLSSLLDMSIGNLEK